MTDLPLTKLSETATTITLGWTPPAGCKGYVFWNQTKRSSTLDGSRSSARFAKPGSYRVEALGLLSAGVWPPVVVPPPAAFMSYPASNAITLQGVTGRTIERLSFRATPAGRSAIVLDNCHQITVRACDFKDVPGCVYAVNCSDIIVEGCRYENITGPSVRTGANVANFAQFNKVSHGWIHHNKGRGGDTEDIVSVYMSSGIDVDDNHFEGTNWKSGSGSGIALGDDGGSRNQARRNTLLNPGQVGMFISGGTDNEISDNIIIGEQRPQSNVGVYVWSINNTPCSGHTVARNRVSWKRADGASNPYWNAGNCGAVDQAGNDWNASIDPETLRVVL